MKDNIYSKVSLIYDYLMQNIDYSNWAEYLIDIFNKYGNSGEKILELASGTGKLSSFLIKRFSKLIATDISFDMICRIDYTKNKVCCDMISIPFNCKFDFIYSTFDSINYLTSKKQLHRFFNEVSSLLESDGIFTFDASLELNSLRNVKNLNRFGKVGNISFSQLSFYNKNTRTHSNYFVFTEDGKIISEEKHKQKIYPLDTYFEIIDKCNMFVVECFDSFSFADANANSERAQFIIKKKN
ncbi:MAG: hypothetical protein Fur0015_06460 [Ignavibacteriales bacterium]